ncbi:MAG: GDP-L-fucose synthase [Candidatus Beckwithbacteria bacterium]
MTKILVTGSDGLLGQAIRALRPKGVVFATRQMADLTDFFQTKKLLETVKPDQVIHLAAVVGGLGGNSTHSGNFFRQNVMINVNVLECSRLTKVKKLLSLMSTCVFPDKTSYPIKEKYLHLGPPHPSNFAYAYTKRMLEVQSRAYRQEWGCNYIVAIPTNIYGPHDFWGIEEGHVIPSLIHKCFKAKKSGKELKVWGSGRPRREFIFSQDLAKIILRLMKQYNEEEPMIISSGKEVRIKDIVNLITRKMEFTGKIVFDQTKPDGQLRKTSSNRKFRKYFPKFKFTPLETGISQTVDWFISHYPQVRK